MKSELLLPAEICIPTFTQSEKKTCTRSFPWAPVFVIVLGLTALSPLAHAQTFTVLHEFSGGRDGARPISVIADAKGNLYGTTEYGGGIGCGIQGGCGTVFKLSAAGKRTTLHSFGAAGDGQYPDSGLIRDSEGNLYGVTGNGGAACSCGTLYKLNGSGTETALFAFAGGRHGNGPDSVVRDSAGNLYGTTQLGGTFNSGTIFKVDPTGKETVLYNFTGGTDGFLPNGVIRDSAGNLYGTTAQGGDLNGCGFASGCGVIFKLDTTNKLTVLHAFTDGVDGGHPFLGVIRDDAGNLYGATDDGGALFFYGTLYKLDTANKLTVLHDFTGGEDGGYPTGTLIRDAAGNLYGTVETGGGDGPFGAVYKLDPTNTETVLYSFLAGTDGSEPNSLFRDAAGNLYGTTANDGDPSCNCGTVFKITF